MGRDTNDFIGWGRSDKQSFTITNGLTGATLDNVNLGRNYAYIVVRCDDCQYIQAASTLAVKVAMAQGEQMNSLYELSANTLTLYAIALPTSGSLQFLLTPALGAQYLHFTLSAAASGGTVQFDVYGIAESVS